MENQCIYLYIALVTESCSDDVAIVIGASLQLTHILLTYIHHFCCAYNYL